MEPTPRAPSRARPIRPTALAALAVLALATAPLARGDQIRTLDGDVEEPLVAIEGEGDRLVLRTATRTIPAADVKEIRLAAADREPRATPVRLFLTTGDELAGEVAGGDDETIAFRTASLGEIQVKLDLLRAIAYPSDDAELRRFRKEVLPLEGKQDLAITRSWSRQEGILERVDEAGIAFATGALGTVPLGPDKIVGARVRQFGKAPAPQGGLRARVDLADGGVLLGKLVSLREGAFLLDGALEKDLEVKAAEVRAVSFLGGRVVYLSDLEPSEVEERAKLISVVFRHREDLNVMGNPLRVDGKLYRKGLGVHAYTRLAYKLDGDHARFRAIIGLDDEAREKRDVVGSVRFQVLVDGKPALGPGGIALSTRDPARPIDVDVRGAATLALVADFGESEDTLSRGAFADAHLVKK